MKKVRTVVSSFESEIFRHLAQKRRGGDDGVSTRQFGRVLKVVIQSSGDICRGFRKKRGVGLAVVVGESHSTVASGNGLTPSKPIRSGLISVMRISTCI